MVKIHKICAFIVLLLGIGVMAYSGLQVAEGERVYQEGNAVYENLRDRVRENKVLSEVSHEEKPTVYIPKVEINYNEPNTINNDNYNYNVNEDENKNENEDEVPPEISHEEKPQIYIPKVEINYDELNTINNDAAAWLYCPDTVIDYPVMKASDYSYYINHLPDGTENANGSLFIDYNCASDFSGQLTVIYGHHMKSGSMFGTLKKYKGQAYYEKHPVMYLYTEQGDYQMELIYGCVISAGQWEERGFIYPENIEELLAYAAHNTTFESAAKYKEGDKLVALSTCSYEFEYARFVVIAILKGQSKKH